MNNNIRNYKHWLSPDESETAIDILKRTALLLRSHAEYSPVRKEMRKGLERQAKEIEEFIYAVRLRGIDDALLLALNRISAEKGRYFLEEVVEAIEKHVSDFNRPNERKR